MIRRRGFTLVEMLIVGALIALFSGIAIIGIQTQYRSNQRKAVIGETRQVASALDFAYNDIGFFPKISHLMFSRTNMELESDIKYGNPLQIYGLLDNYGIPISDAARAERIADKWRGGYFAASQSRTRISQGRGGSRKMISDSGDPVGFDWPVDVWNNPYLLYCLNIDRDSGLLYFVVNKQDANGTFSLNTTPGTEGNFVNAVVSYGPNQVPGGGDIYIANGTPGTTLGSDTGDFALRLYVGDPNQPLGALELKRGNNLIVSDPAAQRIANAWTRRFYVDAGFSIAPGNFPDSGTPDPIDLGDGITNSNALGITDTGSDDVVFTF